MKTIYIIVKNSIEHEYQGGNSDYDYVAPYTLYEEGFFTDKEKAISRAFELFTTMSTNSDYIISPTFELSDPFEDITETFYYFEVVELNLHE